MCQQARVSSQAKNLFSSDREFSNLTSWVLKEDVTQEESRLPGARLYWHIWGIFPWVNRPGIGINQGWARRQHWRPVTLSLQKEFLCVFPSPLAPLWMSEWETHDWVWFCGGDKAGTLTWFHGSEAVVRRAPSAQDPASSEWTFSDTRWRSIPGIHSCWFLIGDLWVFCFEDMLP